MTENDTDELTLGRREASAFDVVIRGYDREQVEERLLQWSEALTEAENQRDEAIVALKQARQLAERQSPAQQLSDRMHKILTLAEQEADDIRTTAAAEVKDAVEQARSEADAIREATQTDLRREIAAAQKEAKSLLVEAHAEVKEVVSAAHAEAEDLALNTARMREAAHAEHQELLARHREEQHRIAEQLRQDIVALEQRRDDVREQLERLRDALASSVGSLSQQA